MVPPFASFSTLLSSTAKPFAAKTIGPLSSKVLRDQQPQQNYISSDNDAMITESAVLNLFPRPNLQPTLHSSSNSPQLLKTMKPRSACFNCKGPHSTEFCPCWYYVLSFDWHFFAVAYTFSWPPYSLCKIHELLLPPNYYYTLLYMLYVRLLYI